MVRSENMTNWFLPPHKGQRVALDPSAPHYERYNRNQARNDKGIIVTDYGNTIRNWVNHYFGNHSNIDVEVRWDNGHANVYKLRDLLPIESEEKFFEVVFVGGDRHELPESKVDAFLNERLIIQGRELRKKEEIGTDNKVRAYKRVATDMYNKVTASGQITAQDTQIIEALASHGYGLQKYEDAPSNDAGIAPTGFTMGSEGLQRAAEAITLSPQGIQDAIDAMQRATADRQRAQEIGNANPFTALDDLFDTGEGIAFRRGDTETNS